MSQNINSISKSTRRRKFLKDKETVDFLLNFKTNSQMKLEQSSSQLNTNVLIKNTNLTVKNDSEVFSTNHSIDITPGSILHDSFSLNNVNVSNENLEYNISFSSNSDFDSDGGQNETDNIILNDKNGILESLAKWAVAQNITLVAFSSLLVVLKDHSCFKNFLLMPELY